MLQSGVLCSPAAAAPALPNTRQRHLVADGHAAKGLGHPPATFPVASPATCPLPARSRSPPALCCSPGAPAFPSVPTSTAGSGRSLFPAKNLVQKTSETSLQTGTQEDQCEGNIVYSTFTYLQLAKFLLLNMLGQQVVHDQSPWTTPSLKWVAKN